jgi:replicative DNA helicase
MTYKRQVIYWANIKHARGIVNACRAALDAASGTTDANLPALVTDLQKAVFDLDRTDRIAPPIQSQADLTDRFLLDLKSPAQGLKTGFNKLDRIIGGLPAGLFTIAAPPGAGKTTYVHQLADQVAELNEAPVLYFTYEQSPYDLWIKSVARLTKIIGAPVKNESIKEGLSSAKVEEAARTYKRFAKWIKVIEGDRQHTVRRIRLLAQREKMKTGKAPVIVIDYLQILPFDDPTQDKRVAVDSLVSDLRRIARDVGSPVIAISAMSRAEYAKVKMSGFKESGGIEYGTDIAAILTVEKESEDGSERDVALNIIKNRNGRRGKVGMKYDMRHDYFEETDQGFVNYVDTLGKDDEQPAQSKKPKKWNARDQKSSSYRQ